MLGIKLGELAETVGLSQTDIANHLGLNRAQVNRWARGVRPVPQRYRKALTAFVLQAAAQRSVEMINQPSLADAADPEHGPRITALRRIRRLMRECIAAELDSDNLGLTRSIGSLIADIASFRDMTPAELRKPATIAKLKKLGLALAQGATLVERISAIPHFSEEEEHVHGDYSSQPNQPGTPGAANARDQ